MLYYSQRPQSQKLKGYKRKAFKDNHTPQRHKMAADRSKDSEKQPHRTTTTAKGCGTKVHWLEGTREQYSRTNITIQKWQTKGDGSKDNKQPSKIPPAGDIPGESHSSKTMLLSSEWASREEAMLPRPTNPQTHKAGLLPRQFALKALNKACFQDSSSQFFL